MKHAYTAQLHVTFLNSPSKSGITVKCLAAVHCQGNNSERFFNSTPIGRLRRSARCFKLQSTPPDRPLLVKARFDGPQRLA